MSRFTTHGAVYPFRAADTGQWSWALAEPLIWEVRDASGAVTSLIAVPAHFLTDLGSIPAWGRWLFNPADPQCAKAYILHDWALVTWGTDRQIEAAGIFYQAMVALGVPRWRRVLQTLVIIAGIDKW